MRPAEKILTHRDYQPVGLQRFVASIRRRMGQTGPLPAGVAETPVVQAEVNHGRWIARCPWCAGAEMVHPGDLRFWCLGCGNDGRGQWLRVELPEQREQIEAELLKRPHEANRNWVPGETVAKLRREHAANGAR